MNIMKKTIKKNEFFDINKLPKDGYFIIPISMSNIFSTQTPEKCYKLLDFFTAKLDKIGCDIVFIYTNGLYYNSNKIGRASCRERV